MEAAKVEAAKVEAAKVEAAKVEAAKVEAAKVEAAKVEAAKVEAAKVEAAKVEAAKVEAAKVEAAKVEAAKIDAEKQSIIDIESIKPVKELVNNIEEKINTPTVVTLDVVPKLVFIVPYRNRESQKNVFTSVMPTLLEDIPITDYKIYYVQQCDVRDFNRGAMRNIGFLAMKEKYPDNYKNITFVFNDVDIMPRTKNLINYETQEGVVKHFYGYTNTLGGIISIKGSDFEKINGYPNFWAWGYEDNLLQYRIMQAGITIDRSQFFKLGDPRFVQLNESMIRTINRSEFDRYISISNEGFSSINELVYNIDDVNSMINVTLFKTEVENNSSQNQSYDLRNGNTPFTINPIQRRVGRRQSMMKLTL